MFCDKENINILTSLLIAHGVKRVVVCPGSRNAPIIHNLNECAEITCYPVTDERSAGFYALGMSLADNAPVAVCVTSGTALLNLAPAVAEATYRHHGLIVISADRPQAWIGQLDGQTLYQPDAFGCHVGKCVCLPEPQNDEERWYCNRLVNEALISVVSRGCKSVQINVPVSEPLFNFNVESLPVERKIEYVAPVADMALFDINVLSRLSSAKRPMLVVGQTGAPCKRFDGYLETISNRMVVINECLSSTYKEPFDIALRHIDDIEAYLPDFIIYVGDTLISKRVKQFLRRAKSAECWAVSSDGEVHDVFMNLCGVVDGAAESAVSAIAGFVSVDGNMADTVEYVRLWHERFDEVKADIETFEPEYSQMAVIRDFFISLEDMDYNYHVHCANSMAVRLAGIYSSDYIWCNRGVNGIEGSVSTAAGFSCTTDDMVFCLTGDMSFFYDENSLWNTNIGGNLRVILLNNGGGGIFKSLNGLQASAAYTDMVAAKHHATAKGLCGDNDIGYLSVCNMDELRVNLARFMTMDTKRPMVLEVFIGDDNHEF